jgi:predicted deacylase
MADVPETLARRARSYTPVIALAAALALTGCAATPPSLAPSLCAGDGLSIHTDFPAAAAHHCSIEPGGITLTIAPEFAPINPSPWYAYRVQSDRPVTLSIKHRYLHGKHRYHPWTSNSGDDWQRLPASAAQTGSGGRDLQFEVQVPAGGLYIAAQPPATLAATQGWIDPLAAQHDLRATVIGTSPAGRPITLYDSGDGPAGMLLILGRQHPPEVTGAWALEHFAERLLEDDALAREWRRRFRLALVPVVNPDGVARGHWRSNARGVDLNRDWGPFTQPETRAIAKWLEAAHRDTALQLLLDFHSTWKDVLYVPHPSDNPLPYGFASAWRAALDDALGEAAPEWSGQHNPGLPTARSWARAQYGVTSVTYEVGDNTDHSEVRAEARTAAATMMQTLLDTQP